MEALLLTLRQPLFAGVETHPIAGKIGTFLLLNEVLPTPEQAALAPADLSFLLVQPRGGEAGARCLALGFPDLAHAVFLHTLLAAVSAPTANPDQQPELLVAADPELLATLLLARWFAQAGLGQAYEILVSAELASQVPGHAPVAVRGGHQVLWP